MNQLALKIEGSIQKESLINRETSLCIYSEVEQPGVLAGPITLRSCGSNPTLAIILLVNLWLSLYTLNS